MSIIFQTVIFFLCITPFLWAYHQQHTWFQWLPYALLRLGKGRSFFIQWLIYSPMFVIWLLLCHWLDVKAWHGVAAALIAFAMLLALQAMRQLENQHKAKRIKECKHESNKHH